MPKLRGGVKRQPSEDECPDQRVDGEDAAGKRQQEGMAQGRPKTTFMMRTGNQTAIATVAAAAMISDHVGAWTLTPERMTRMPSATKAAIVQM